MEATFAILVVSTIIALFESFIFKVWCDRRKLWFSRGAFMAVVTGAILGGFMGILCLLIIYEGSKTQSTQLLLNIFCNGSSGAFGMCLWFATVIVCNISVILGSLLGGWLGFWLWVNSTS